MKNHTPPHTLAPPLRQPVFTSLLRWLVFSLLAMFSCAMQAGAAAPTLSNPSSASISYTTVTLGGTLDNNGGDPLDPVTERGVVFSTVNADPVVGTTLNDITAAADTPGLFSFSATGLSQGTTYYFQAYATNTAGTTRTSVGTFTTRILTVANPSHTGVSYTTATLGGEVTDAGDPTATIRGVVYSTAPTPVVGVADSVEEAFAGSTGTFTLPVEGLTPGTVYHYRAYASNDDGVTYTYSAASSFTTRILTVANPSHTGGVSYTTATLGGEVTDAGDPTATIRGVVYSTTPTPVVGVADSVEQTFDGSTGTFTLPVTGLTPGTVYHYRAYASNDDGVTYTYSAASSFTTLALPTVSTPTAEAITATTAQLGGTVDSAGASALTQRGVVYSVKALKATPDITDGKAIEGATTVDSFFVDVEGLLAGTEYAYRAYAINAGGIPAYSAVAYFTTVTAKPTVSTPGSSSIQKTTATLSGVVDHNGGLTLSARGFVYSRTNTSPTIGGAGTTNAIADGIISGSFSKGVTGLLPGETYHYKAYATNSKGTTYTSVATFLTASDVPTVTSPTWTGLSARGVTMGGNVTDTNGSNLLARGVVYVAGTGTPTISDSSVLASGTTTGTFTAAVSTLTPGTRYTFRAYARNGVGYGYSAPSTFTTPAAAPTVTTGSSSAIAGGTSAGLAGTVTLTNGAAITASGVVVSRFSINPTPTIGGADTKNAPDDTPGVGAFSVTATGLVANTKYAYRAYATNSKGTSYGAALSFTTAAGVPTINSPTKANISSRSVTLGATVANANGGVMSSRGVKVYQSGQLLRTIPAGTAGVGVFTVNVTGLTPATAYTFVAYATNNVGTSETAQTLFTAFTTLATKPTLELPTAGSITTTGARLGGTVTSNNGATITKYGVVYSSTNTNPIVGGAGVFKTEVVGALTNGQAFALTVASLKPGKTYYYRAYAINSKGTGYSVKDTFQTPASAPTVSTPTIGTVTTVSAVLGGRVVSANGSAITRRGIVYSRTSLDSTPTLAEGRDSKPVIGTTGTFTVTVGGLTPGVKYSFRVFATNGVDTSYTNPVTFTTTALSIPLAGASVAGASDTTDTYYTTDAATGLKYLTIVISDASQAPTVEVSGNLTDWFSGSSHTTVISDAGGILKVRDNTPVTADSKRYIRVRP